MAKLFDVKVTGTRQVATVLKLIRKQIHASVANDLVEDYLLATARARFEKVGTTGVAQRAPNGQFWAPPKNSTLRRRKANKFNPSQALFATGRLRDSLKIIKRVPKSFKGGTAITQVGVPASSSEFSKASLHQFGGNNKQGVYIRARPFLGVNNSSDVKAINALINEAIRSTR